MSWIETYAEIFLIPCVAGGVIVVFLIIQILKNLWEELKNEREKEKKNEK